MSYQEITHFAQTWGLILLLALFAAAVVYALWPANKDTFQRAGRMPLEENDDGRP
ncbi:MAG: cbb3-type cytochrome c oxidase subunit 3 [Hyphomonadaceae bacterium]